MTQKFSLSSITRKAYLQQRSVALIGDRNESNRQQANLSATILSVKNDLINGQSIKIPLEVHEVDGEYLLVDGHHRYDGALTYCREAKIDLESFQVLVNVIEGSTLQAAIDASFKANLNHGVGLTDAERKQLYFRKYVWEQLVPTLAVIRSDTGCSKGTASNIAFVTRWCIKHIGGDDFGNDFGDDIETVEYLKHCMTKAVERLGIDPTNLDEYGLPSYSLLFKTVKKETVDTSSDIDERALNIVYAESAIADIVKEYGVDALREGLRKHRTDAYGIKVSRRSLWIKKPTSAALLFIPEYEQEDAGDF
jgi:hypothetical protein